MAVVSLFCALSMMLLSARTVTCFTRVICSSYTKKVATINHQRSRIASLSSLNGVPKVSKGDMIALAERVKEINDLSGIESVEKANFVHFNFDGLTYGYVSHKFASMLKNFDDVFEYKEVADGGTIQLTAAVLKLNLMDRSIAVGKATAALKEQKIITGLHINSPSCILTTAAHLYTLYLYCLVSEFIPVLIDIISLCVIFNIFSLCVLFVPRMEG